MTSTSQQILSATVSAPKKRNKKNLLATLFFIMGAPHIYGIMQSGKTRRKFVKHYSNSFTRSSHLSNEGESVISNNTLRPLLSRYLSILLGVAVAGIMEIFVF